jgi:hypothetical protein
MEVPIVPDVGCECLACHCRCHYCRAKRHKSLWFWSCAHQTSWLGPDSDSDFSLVSFGRSGMGVDLRRPKAACDTYLTFCGSLQQLARARGKYTG